MIPWGLFYVVPSFVSACIWFVPEVSSHHGWLISTANLTQSPRWLVLKDRNEDAIESLRKLRSGKYTDEQIDIEYRGILESIEKERQKGTFLDIFRKRHVTRTWVVIGANFFLQGTGQLFTSIYGALFAKSLGTINPFTVTIMIAVVNVFTSLLAMVLTDKLGRR